MQDTQIYPGRVRPFDDECSLNEIRAVIILTYLKFVYNQILPNRQTGYETGRVEIPSMAFTRKRQIVIGILLVFILSGIYVYSNPRERLQTFSFGLACFIAGFLAENLRKRKTG